MKNLYEAFVAYVHFKNENQVVPNNFYSDALEFTSEEISTNALRKRFFRLLNHLHEDNEDYVYQTLTDMSLIAISKSKFLELFSSFSFEKNDNIDKNKSVVVDDQKVYDELEVTHDKEQNTVQTKSTRIKTLEDALESANVDLNIYEVKKWIANSWEVTSWKSGKAEVRTNYQVKIWLENKFFEKVDPEWTNQYFNELINKVPFDFKNLSRRITSFEAPVVCAISDLHAGSISENMKMTPDFNIKVLEEKLMAISDYLNSLGRPVHLKILGDLIESFTGKNHRDTWKQIEMHGMEVMFAVYDLLYKMVDNTPTIKSIDIISGNHDRISSSNEDDTEGQVAYGVYQLLKRSVNDDIEINYDPLILSSSHGNINYILMHGHKRISKRNPAEIILDYGDPKKFNVILTGHLHNEAIKASTMRYKHYQIPSLVTGGQFSQDIGAHSPAGFVVFEENHLGFADSTFKCV